MKFNKVFTNSEKLSAVILYLKLTGSHPLEDRSVRELAKRLGVSRQNLLNWKNQLCSRADEVFSKQRISALESRIDDLILENNNLRRLNSEDEDEE
jgi:transposase-like protein